MNTEGKKDQPIQRLAENCLKILERAHQDFNALLNRWQSNAEGQYAGCFLASNLKRNVCCEYCKEKKMLPYNDSSKKISCSEN